jgi:ABC-type multidrug transport system ATPase subunit
VGDEIVIKELVKHFGDVKAVNGLNLGIKKGEMFGFLGPNGAGKTTTISMLCGLLEPTVGMDARARRRTWEFIGSLKDQGKTVILTTHYIEEAQALSDRVGIIDYGELIALDTPEALMAEHEALDLEGVFLKITGRRIAEGS